VASPPPELQGIALPWAEADGELPRHFASREALEAELHRRFPEASGGLSPIRGGRRAAEQRLAAVQPARYARSRNFLDGAVTRLSPYIRHGVLSLAEVREAVFRKLHAEGGREAGEKLINELGWRDFWQRVWRQLGEAIWESQEPLKTGHSPASYAAELPADIAAAGTGLACMDAFSRELVETGWLHNHARMWMAAYVVHWRRVRWQAGARWFLQHLVDGDPASNNLSWQWVASSFSHKPYVFNRSNLERYTGGRLCDGCDAAASGSCPFDASYETLQERLFAPAAPEPVRGGWNERPRRSSNPATARRR
jgi:deoxyribodipyrimidine photo-lyase